MKKQCKYCGSEFEEKYQGQIYCSKSCKGHHQSETNRILKEKEYSKSPKICPLCGSPIPYQKRKNKFCSQSCANSYTNSTRTRNPWDISSRIKFSQKTIKNPDTSKSIYIQHKCKYCGIYTQNINNICDECLPYIYRVKVYDKIGLTGSLKERDDKLTNILYNEYFINAKSTCQIENEIGISNQTVRNYINRQYKTRNLSQGVSLAIKLGRLHPCAERTHSNFKTGIHISWDGSIYNYKSSWEDQYMEELDNLKIPYKYEPFRIEYYDTTQLVYRTAFPDFYLPERHELIELKSSYTLGDLQVMKDKFKAYKDNGYTPILLLDWKYIGYDELMKL